jgi:hypothetical protein
LLQKIQDGSKIQLQQQGQIKLMLSTLFKEKIVDTPQAFGSFVDGEGVKYCAISALLKYLGYDMATTTTATLSNKIQNDNKKNNNNNMDIELIPSNVLERVEDFVRYGNFKMNPPRCFCSKPDYYFSYISSLLIHLNDYHKMTFTQIGNWLESKGM